jgi:hypothetical protein
MLRSSLAAKSSLASDPQQASDKLKHEAHAVTPDVC